MNTQNLQQPGQPSASPGSKDTPPAFDPMKGVVTSGSGGCIPPGNYEADFAGAEYLPVSEPNPMTGKGERKWPSVRFNWQLDDGRMAPRETPANYGSKSGYSQTVGWLLGRTLTPGEPFDLMACVGRRYLITVGPKMNKAGQPTGWTEVTACIPLPPKKQ
jgi:hypothetical protein